MVTTTAGAAGSLFRLLVERLHGAVWGDAARLKVTDTPFIDATQDRPKTSAEIRERIFHLGRHHRVCLAGNQTIVLKFLKLLREHLGIGLRHGFLQLRETFRAVKEIPKNEGLVLAADERERGAHRAVRGFGNGVVFEGGHTEFLSGLLFRKYIP